MTYLEMHISTPRFPLDSEDDDEEFIRQYQFDLVESDCENDEHAGEMIVSVFMGASAYNAGADLIEYADMRDQDLYEVSELLYRGKRGLANTLEEEVPHGSNVIFIEKLFLEPEYRGKGLGTKFIERVLNWLDPGNMLAAVVYPVANCYFQRGERPNDPYQERALKAGATKKLSAWYESLGFEKWRRSGYLYLRGESYQRVLPLRQDQRHNQKFWPVSLTLSQTQRMV